VTTRHLGYRTVVTSAEWIHGRVDIWTGKGRQRKRWINFAKDACNIQGLSLEDAFHTRKTDINRKAVKKHIHVAMAVNKRGKKEKGCTPFGFGCSWLPTNLLFI